MVRIAVLSMKDIINKLIIIIGVIIVCIMLFSVCTRLMLNVNLVKRHIEYSIPIYNKSNGINIIQEIFKGILSQEIGFVSKKNSELISSSSTDNKFITQINDKDVEEVIQNEDVGNKIITVDSINNKQYKIGNNIEYIDIKNGTKLDIDYNKLLNQKLNIFKNNKLPTILIIHTHGSETYKGVEHTDYFRNEDINLNVVKVGHELASILSNSGYEVIHDTRLYDYPTYSGSYTRTLSSIQEYIKQNDNTQIVLDIHRDAIASDENFAPTANIDGNEVSKIMIISGTNQGGLQHPNWEENLKLALQLYNTAYEIYPELFRNLNITKSRYNQHATNGSLILEVGATGNTLDQSIMSMRYFAKILDETLKKNWGGYNE